MNKLKEVVYSVLPITIIVLVLNFTVAPIGGELIGRFLVGAILIIIGLAIFLFGAEIGIQPIGNLMGSLIARKKKIWIVVIFGFILGFLINAAEPDLQVLAKQVSEVTGGSISQLSLVMVVSIGVGVMVVVGLFRVIFKVPLSRLLTIIYIGILGLGVLSSDGFLGIAFDSGGATTGAMTVPFILALGMGVSSVQGGKQSEEDSFGLVGLASAGPMIAVLIMSIFNKIDQSAVNVVGGEAIVKGILNPFLKVIPTLLLEVAMTLSPLLILFLIFQKLYFKLSKKSFARILKGLIYTFIGFVLFLAGVNAGFMEAGSAIGYSAAASTTPWFVIPIGFILGFAVVFAEPAVYVLNEQIEDVTSGHIKRSMILYALSIGVAIAVTLSMLRILIPSIQLWHYLLPGYVLAIGLSYFAPPLFVGIAFDSGGVASGPMTATFILAFAQGVAEATPGANVLMDAFGVIAMVALTPLIALQILGILYKIKASKKGVDLDGKGY